tara:strand:+ start:1670 stop:2032 length:363 start_codon:yes stop_codon:yes gene_type:complete
MALARTDLSAVTQIGAGASSAVVTGAGNTVFIKSVQFYNLDQSNEQNVTVYIVPGSGAGVGYGSTTNAIARIGLGTDDTFFYEPAYPITLRKDSNDALTVLNEGSVNNSINVYVSGDMEV